MSVFMRKLPMLSTFGNDLRTFQLTDIYQNYIGILIAEPAKKPQTVLASRNQFHQVKCWVAQKLPQIYTANPNTDTQNYSTDLR